MFTLNRSRHPISDNVGFLQLNNPFIRDLVFAAEGLRADAPDADKLRAIQTFRTSLKQAVLAKEQGEHKRRLDDQDCRDVVATALGANARRATQQQIENAALILAERLQEAETTEQVRALQQENKKLKAAEEARAKKEDKPSPMASGGASNTSLAQALNNKVSFDAEMAFGKAVMEVLLLCSFELVLYTAIEYRQKRPESFGDLLEVLVNVGGSMSHRLHEIALGVEETGSMDPNMIGPQSAAAAAAKLAPRPAPAH